MNTNHTHTTPFLSTSPPTRRQMLAGMGGLVAATAASVGAIHPLVATAQGDLQATPATGPEGAAMQFVYSFEAQFTGSLPVGMTPRGVRLDFPYAGEVVAGALEGATVQGTDYLLLRPDGVGVIDARGLVTALDGHAVSYRATGYVLMPAGVELPLDMLLDPGFVWPDMDLILHGFELYETGAADLAWLNRTALAFLGTANPGTGALIATFYAIAPIPELTSG